MIDALEQIKLIPTPIDLFLLKSIQEALLTNHYQQTPLEKFQNPLARRLESEQAITLLQHPTEAMMISVYRVSREIINFLYDEERHWKKIYQPDLQEDSHVIAFGAFKELPTYRQVKRLLDDNDPNMLAEIMFIHYKIGALIRNRPISYPSIRAPIGRLAELIRDFDHQGPPISFFEEGLKIPGREGFRYREYISNTVFYKSPLYTAPGNRGRCGEIEYILTHQLGLFLQEQIVHAAGLPVHSSTWVADCKAQKPDFESQYVIDLIENDAVYVAGPSGMTSILLGQMEVLANFETEILKQNYLSAVLAYIVAGGFHSIHEVVGPAQYVLNLIPGYRVVVPVKGVMAPPPNYSQFFEQQSVIDSEFESRTNQAWDQYMVYFKDNYCANYRPELLEAFQSSAPSPGTPSRFSPGFFTPVSPSPVFPEQTPSPAQLLNIDSLNLNV